MDMIEEVLIGVKVLKVRSEEGLGRSKLIWKMVVDFMDKVLGLVKLIVGFLLIVWKILLIVFIYNVRNFDGKYIVNIFICILFKKVFILENNEMKVYFKIFKIYGVIWKSYK